MSEKDGDNQAVDLEGFNLYTDFWAKEIYYGINELSVIENRAQKPQYSITTEGQSIGHFRNGFITVSILYGIVLVPDWVRVLIFTVDVGNDEEIGRSGECSFYPVCAAIWYGVNELFCCIGDSCLFVYIRR